MFRKYVPLITTPAPLITAGLKWSSPPVLGGVGFKSLVMKGAITAGSQPDGDVPKPSPPVQQPAVLTPSRNKKKIVHAAAPLHLPHAAALHLPHAAAPLAPRPPPLAPMPRKKGGEGAAGKARAPSAVELHAGSLPLARGSGRRRSNTRAPASGSRSRAPAVARSRAPAVGRRPTVGRRPAVELPRRAGVELPRRRSSSHGRLRSSSRGAPMVAGQQSSSRGGPASRA